MLKVSAQGVFSVSTHYTSLSHRLGMLLRKEPGFVTPIQIHSSPPVCELFGIENKHPPTLLSSPLSMAKHSCTALGCRQWHGGVERGMGAVLTLRWQVTGYCRGDDRWSHSPWLCDTLQRSYWLTNKALCRFTLPATEQENLAFENTPILKLLVFFGVK